jgi:glycerol-3-phosphate O-acyltransferase/dihydroxyacetone phosphate acyltransferase
VRELTARIERAMRGVSLNLQYWEDEPLVRTAEAIWRAEFDRAKSQPDPAVEIQRLRTVTSALHALRFNDAEDWRQTAVWLRAHGRALETLGLTPGTLVTDVGFWAAVRWALVRLPFIVMLPISLLGAIVFWLPKEVTAAVAAGIAKKEGDDALVTHRVLVGGVVFPLWFLVMAIVVGLLAGWPWGVLTLALQPAWAFAALTVGERRQRAWLTVRRYFLRHLERPRLEKLRARQKELAIQLRHLLDAAGVA